jgi:AbrB family looped-hinge helix DNA binding protein
MKTAIDSAGRLVIPKDMRREAGLKPGMILDVRWRGGVIEIEPAPQPVTLQKRGRLLVAVPVKPVERLRSETVERTRRQVRREGALP